jgi:murein L,D-transpeptidase YcbB/YkuD
MAQADSPFDTVYSSAGCVRLRNSRGLTQAVGKKVQISVDDVFVVLDASNSNGYRKGLE